MHVHGTRDVMGDVGGEYHVRYTQLMVVDHWMSDLHGLEMGSSIVGW